MLSSIVERCGTDRMESKMRKPCVVLSVLDLYKPMFFTPAAFERIRDLADLRIDPDPVGHASAESREMLREAEVVGTAW